MISARKSAYAAHYIYSFFFYFSDYNIVTSLSIVFVMGSQTGHRNQCGEVSQC